jgi:arginine repressor
MKNEKNGMFQTKGMLMVCVGGALALALAATPALANQAADQPGMPSASRSKTMHETVTVTSIDKSARMLTVKNEDGEARSIQVPSDVKAFDKLKKGDKIDVDYTESVALSMLPPGTKPSASEKAAMAPTGKESGVAGKQVTISAEVLEVDVANNKVVFKGPKGNARVVTVSDPEMQAKLPSLKKGQVVQFTYTEAVALAIQPKK